MAKNEIGEECNYCKRSYSNVAAVVENGNEKCVDSIHNKDKRFKCTKCDYAAFRNDVLKKHVEFKHKQITNKKPLTVTDERMTRFIMSISEAAEMILNVTHISKDGEIFINKGT